LEVKVANIAKIAKFFPLGSSFGREPIKALNVFPSRGLRQVPRESPTRQ
jgi:hypothetical protein